MKNPKQTILKIAIHRSDESAVFGENSIHIELLDEGAGGFIKLTSMMDGSSIRLDIEELRSITKIANSMALNYEKQNKGAL